MPSEAQVDAQNFYANLLAEINLRVDAINHCTLGFSGLQPPFVKEFCYLQIRMICELVALGCLLAHGDLEQTSSKKMQGEWSAEKIMTELGKLHPHFYPQPVIQTKTPLGYHLQAKPTFLSKSDFLVLYGKCGDMLHRGSLKKLLKGQFPVQIDYPEITAKAQKLIDLLSNHIIVTKSGKHVFLAVLKNADDNMRPQVAVASAPEGQAMDYKNKNFLKETS